MNLTKKAVVLTAALLITATGVQAKTFRMALGDAQGLVQRFHTLARQFEGTGRGLAVLDLTTWEFP